MPRLIPPLGSSCLLALTVLAAGCSTGGGAPVAAPTYNPDGAADQAMTDLDANKDGALAAKELDAAPGLKAALKAIDANKDGKVGRDELLARLKVYADSQVGLAQMSFQVLLDGKPLDGAKVTFAPEPFMAGSLKPAAGTTDAQGNVVPTTEGQTLPGLPYGLFRVSVSKPDGGGKETVPAKFNAQTTLGVEVFQAPRGGDSNTVLRLTSR